MKLEELEAFACAAKTSNITVAANNLGIPQATLGDRIKSLEGEVGVLFHRNPRPPYLALTELGLRILPDSLEMLELSRRMRAQSVQLRRPGFLRIGVNESVQHTWLFQWLTRLRAERPEIEIELRVDTTDGLEERMNGGTLDLAIGFRPLGDRDVHKRQLPSLSMAFVGTAERHDERTYTLEEIAREGLITFQTGSQPHRAVLNLLRTNRVEQYRLDLVSSISAMVEAVLLGFGVATLPRALVDRRRTDPELRILSCDVALPSLPVWLSWPEYQRDPRREAAIEGLERFAKESLSAGTRG
jgi:DNA-binding transcriptional LysR family regulator